MICYWLCSCTCCCLPARARGQTLMMFTHIFSWGLISKEPGPVKLLAETSARQKLFEFFSFLTRTELNWRCRWQGCGLLGLENKCVHHFAVRATVPNSRLVQQFLRTWKRIKDHFPPILHYFFSSRFVQVEHWCKGWYSCWEKVLGLCVPFAHSDCSTRVLPPKSCTLPSFCFVICHLIVLFLFMITFLMPFHCLHSEPSTPVQGKRLCMLFSTAIITLI